MFVRSSSFVSVVNFTPSTQFRPWLRISSSIGSPMPVWSIRTFLKLSFLCARFRCPMTWV